MSQPASCYQVLSSIAKFYALPLDLTDFSKPLNTPTKFPPRPLNIFIPPSLCYMNFPLSAMHAALLWISCFNNQCFFSVKKQCIILFSLLDMLDCTVMVAIEFTITSFFGRKKVNIPKLRCHGIDVFISHVVVMIGCSCGSWWCDRCCNRSLGHCHNQLTS